MSIKKRCAKAGCRELIRLGERYCDKHKNYNDKQYNKQIRHNKALQANGKTNKEIADFYNSRDWKNRREQVLIRDNFLCQNCLRNGVISTATIVHHKRELRAKDGWEHRLEMNNLESICQSCHNHVDHEWSQKNRK